MSLYDDSDSDDIYQSDEEVRCILDVPSSSSSSSEEPEENSQGGIPQESFVERLSRYSEDNKGHFFKVKSLKLAWELKGRVPSNIVCDACVFSPFRSVFLLTFKRSKEKDKSLQYNAKLARHLITSVRKHLFPSFTVISGVIDIDTDCHTDENFRIQLEKLETEARLSSIPQWLYMDQVKHDQLLSFIRKMTPNWDLSPKNRGNCEDVMSPNAVFSEQAMSNASSPAQGRRRKRNNDKADHCTSTRTSSRSPEHKKNGRITIKGNTTPPGTSSHAVTTKVLSF